MIKVAMPVLNVTFNYCLLKCFKILFIIEEKSKYQKFIRSTELNYKYVRDNSKIVCMYK